ncbi:MAG: hypothetical protein GYA87_00575, partial [Christensenellaceae bacterium]|nr:hypothetical protein [Christensenellaceae bacterium]
MKKISSVLLVIIFFLGILPTNVFADNAFTSKATLTVQAVPNFTELKVNQRFAVTTTATGGTAPYTYANYVIKDGKIIYRGWYTSNRVFYYVPKTVGTYQVKSFVKDLSGTIKAVTTVPIKVTNYPIPPLNIYVSMNKTSMYKNETVIVRASATGGVGNYMYAFYVYKDGQLIKKYPYSTNQILYYKATMPGAYKFTAFVRDSNNKRIAKSTTILSVLVKPKYRALIIGQHQYWDHVLAGTDVDANNMNTMFVNKPLYGTMTRIIKKLDLTDKEILNAIHEAFLGADDDSVSIFYYSGHGSSDG